MDEILKTIYYDTKHEASFSSKEKLFAAAKKKWRGLTLAQVEDWLCNQDAHTLHRKIKRNFKRKPVIAHNVDATWQVDLADVSSFAQYNRNVKFIFVAIDVLSRFAFLVPLGNKSAGSIVGALKHIFRKYNRVPKYIQTDQGREFLNFSVKSLLKSKGIRHYTTTGDDPKCAIAERFIRTLRGKMTKYMTSTGDSSYIDKLQDFAESYNNTVHSRLKLKPSDVTEITRQLAFDNLYGNYYQLVNKTMPSKRSNLFEGDFVRIARKKDVFEKKSMTPNFTREMFKVKSVDVNPHWTTYKLEDLDGEDITSIFYPDEVVKVKSKDKWEIEDILATKVSNRIKYGLVKWLGYPHKFNSWVKLS